MWLLLPGTKRSLGTVLVFAAILGLAVRLRCAGQGCKLLPKPCTYQEPGIELVCSLLPK